MKVKRTPSAFTLIELLVVIGIIAVLIAILLPVLSRTRALAKSTKCLAQMRQIGLGFIMYRNDWKDKLPPLTWDPARVAATDPHAGKQYGMVDCIGPYVGRPDFGGLTGVPGTAKEFSTFWSGAAIKKRFQTSVFCCPNTPDAIAWGNAVGSASYAESTYMQKGSGTFSGPNTRPWAKVRPYHDIPDPSIKIHVSDADDWTLGDVAGVVLGDPNPNRNFSIYRHMDGCNILFADCHAAFYRADYIVGGITTDAVTPINNFNLR